VAYSKLNQKDNFIRNEPYYKTNISGSDYYIPGGFDYGFDQFERTRNGVYVGLQWAPNEKFDVAETFFYSKYKSSGSGQGAFILSKILAVDPAVSKFDSNNGLISSPNLFTRNPSTFTTTGASNMYATGDTGVNQSSSDTLDSSTVVHWRPSQRWDIKGAFQFVNSVSSAKSYDLFDSLPQGVGYGVTETSSQPNISFPAAVQELYKDPNNYFWSAHMDHLSHNDGEEHAAHLDVRYELSSEGFFRSAQVGARFANRTEQDADSGYNWSPFCKGWNGCAQVPLGSSPTQPGDIAYQTFGNFFRGSVTAPGGVYLPSFGFAGQYNPAANVAQLGGSVTGSQNPDKSVKNPYTLGPGDYSYERATNTAAYGLIRFANDNAVRFDGNIGIRYVKIHNSSYGNFVQGAVVLPRLPVRLRVQRRYTPRNTTVAVAAARPRGVCRRSISALSRRISSSSARRTRRPWTSRVSTTRAPTAAMAQTCRGQPLPVVVRSRASPQTRAIRL